MPLHMPIMAAFLLCTTAFPVLAQSGQPSSPASQLSQGGGPGFDGYIRRGGDAGTRDTRGSTPSARDQLNDGTEMSRDRIDGFNAAIDQQFPMTPEMIRRYRDINRTNERAMNERPEPEAEMSSAIVSLEPGEAPVSVNVAPGVATVVSFYDVTGEPWPISQSLAGDSEDFEVVQLGDGTGNLAVTPLQGYGFTNLVVLLEGQSKPAVLRLRVNDRVAHFRRDVQVMGRGPNAATNTAANEMRVEEAGSGTLLAALSGVDLPAGARPVGVAGVDARAWMIGDQIYLRSPHALLSPSWTASMSGPDGVRVYAIPKRSRALFSVDGSFVAAEIMLP